MGSRRPASAATRAKLRRLIHARRPWDYSTGPWSAAGKARSARNAWKHGFYSRDARALREALRTVCGVNIAGVTDTCQGRKFCGL